MIGEPAETAAATSVAEARFRVHGLSIGVRSDEPAVIETVRRSYAAFASRPGDGEPSVWIDARRPRPSDTRGPIPAQRARQLEIATVLGALDGFVMAVVAGLDERGILGTHAGVVVIDGRAVLLAGPSGRGKSTLTLALVRDGARWLTDELALIDADGRTVLPYPRALHVSPATVDLLPELDFLRRRPRYALGADSEWSVSVEDLHSAFEATVADPTPLGLIVLLDERGSVEEEPLITPATSADATFALLRGTPAAVRDFAGTMRRLGQIASGVAVVRLRATDPARTSAAIHAHLRGTTLDPAPRSVARRGLLRSYRESGRTAWIEARGRSMHPSIPAGSRLLVDFGRMPGRRGEVIVFDRGDETIAHRLVARRVTPEGTRLIAKGDGEAYLDPAIAEDDVLGVVRRVRTPEGRDVAWPDGSRRAAAVAGVSWMSGRGAGAATRLVRRVPLSATVRRAALHGLLGLSRVPTRVVTASFPGLTGGQRKEGGETDGVREP